MAKSGENNGMNTMKQGASLPQVRGEDLYIPFVGAIIERTGQGGKTEVLLQIRDKESDPTYTGCYEIPGGKMSAFEDVYESLAREVEEECGLTITFVHNQDERIDYVVRGVESSLITPFCVTQMREGPFVGLIFLCKAEGDLLLQSSEAKGASWFSRGALYDLVERTPEKIYTAFLAPLKYYLMGNS